MRALTLVLSLLAPAAPPAAIPSPLAHPAPPPVFMGAVGVVGLAGPVRAPAVDAVRRLEVFVERRRRARDELEPGVLDELSALLDEIRVLEREQPERRPDVVAALVRLAALDDFDPAQGGPRRGEQLTAGGLGRRELQKRFAGDGVEELGRLIARPLDDPDHDPDERLAAARALSGRYVNGTLGPLLAGARAPDDLVRRASQQSLAGWKDVGLHIFFLDELERGSGFLSPIQTHFEATRETLGDETLTRMRDVLGRMLFSEDWRVATRGRQLVPTLDARRAVPLLLESLRLWNRRLEEGEGSLRIRHEIVQELQRISGRSLGTSAERWENWWQRVVEGTIELPEESDPEAYTSASFFGLRVVSDRVMFVLDRSGSMETHFGTGGRTRYEEAMHQLLTYLKTAGPDTRFGIVLFNDKALRWRNELRSATKANRDKLERWLAGKPPAGGTALREAVFESVGYRRGRLNLERLDVDTVVVLCDGETNRGPDWVRGWLSEINEEAQLIFHCVQVGRKSDGTLERLTKETGGDLVTVRG